MQKADVNPADTPLATKVSGEYGSLVVPNRNTQENQEIRKADQRLEQQMLYADLGPAMGAVIIKAASAATGDRRRINQAQEDVRLAEGLPKKKKLSSSSLDDETIQQLISVLGVDAAQKVVDVVDKFNAQATKTQNITAGQAAQLSKDLASALAGKESIQTLRLAPQAVEKPDFERNANNARAIDDAVSEGEILEAVDSTVTNALLPEDVRGDPVLYRERAAKLGDIITSSRQNPQSMGELLTTPQGIAAIQEKLATLKDTKSRVDFLVELKSVLGTAAFGQVVDRYEVLRGTPVACEILQLAGPGKDAMGAAVAVVFEKKQALLSPEQVNRCAEFLSKRHGEMLAVFDRNRDELHVKAAQDERTLAQAQAGLSKILVDEGLAKPVVISKDQLAAHVVARLPGLKGKSLKEMHTVIAAAAATDDQSQEEFYKAVEGLGFKQLPDQYDTSEAGQEKNQQIRRTLERIAAPLKQFSEAYDSRTEIRERLKAGSADIASVTKTDLVQLFSPLLPEYSAQLLDQNRREARVALSAREVEIEHLRTQPERAAECALLCQERDSIAWNAVSYQVRHTLRVSPNDTTEPQRLLLEFQSLPPGAVGRSEAYLRAASALRKEIETVDLYVKTLDAIQKSSEKTVKSLKLDIEYFNEQIAKEQNDLPSSWWDPQKYGKGTTNILNFQTKIEHTQKVLKKSQATLESASKFLGKDSASLRSVLYERMVSQSELIADGKTKFPTVRTFDEASAESQISDTFKQLLDAREQSADALLGCAAPRHSSVSSKSSLTEGRAQESLLQIERVNALLTKDFTLEPSKEALAALRGVVESKDAIGMALSDGSLTSLSPREQMNHLYARISGDDAVKAKLFLLTFDRPQNLALLDEKFSDSSTQVSPSEVWRGISSRKPSEVAPYVSAMAAKRTMQEATRQLLDLPSEKLEDVRSEYLRITGQTLGEAFLLIRPGGSLGQEFLFSFADSALLTKNDLKPFIGEKIEEAGSLLERKKLMGRLLQSDEAVTIDDGSAANSGIAERLKNEAPERVALSTAYQSLVQQGRIDEALTAGARLKEMDAGLARFVAKSHEKASAEYLARSGLAARISDRAALEHYSCQGSTVSVATKRAKEIASYISDDTPPGPVLLEVVRDMALTQGEMLLVSALYREQCASPLREQGKTPLSGDLAKDLATRGAYSETSKADTQRVKNLLEGGPKALTSYDIESMTEGIRTRNPRLTAKAMIALEARGLLQRSVEGLQSSSSDAREAFSQFKESPEGREVGAYLKAVKENDTVTRGVIELKNASAFATQDPIGSLNAMTAFRNAHQGPGLVKAMVAYKALYRADMVSDLGKIVPPCLSSSVGSVLSSDPVQYAKAPLIVAQQALGSATTAVNQKLLATAIAMAPDEASRKALMAGLNEFVAGMPDAIKYRDARGPSVVQYVRVTGGTLGIEKANLLSDLFKASLNSNSHSVPLAQQLEEIDEFEEHYRALVSLQKKGEQVHAEAIATLQTAASAAHHARDEQANRTVSKSIARENEGSHNAFLGDQKALINEQRVALRDLRTTKQSMTNRMQCRLEDHSLGEESIFTMDGIRSQAFDASQRFALVDWVVARHDAFMRWQIDAGKSQRRLENFDNWVTFGTAVTKVIVVTAVGITTGPVTAFAVATAMNVGEKAFRCAFNGLSLNDALRQGAFDLAFDVAFVGLSTIRIFKLTAVGNHYGTGVAGKTIFGKWVVSIGRTGPQLSNTGRNAVMHTREAGELLSRGVAKPLREAAKLVEKVAQDPKVLSQYVEVSVRELYKDVLAYAPWLLSQDASNKSANLPTPVGPVAVPNGVRSFAQPIPGPKVVATEPPVVPNPNEPLNQSIPGAQGATGNGTPVGQIPNPNSPGNAAVANPANGQTGNPVSGVAVTPGDVQNANQPQAPAPGAGAQATQPATPAAPGNGNNAAAGAPVQGAQVPAPAGPVIGQPVVPVSPPVNQQNQPPATPAPLAVEPITTVIPPQQLVAAMQTPLEPDWVEDAIQEYFKGLGEGLVWMFAAPPTPSRPPSNPPPSQPPPPSVADVPKPKKSAPPPSDPPGNSGPAFAMSGESSINSYTAHQGDRAVTVTAGALGTAQPLGIVSSNAVQDSHAHSATQSIAMSTAEATSITLVVSSSLTHSGVSAEAVTQTAALVVAASADPWQAMAASEGDLMRDSKRRALALQAVADQSNRDSAAMTALRVSEEQSSVARSVAESQAAVAIAKAREVESAPVPKMTSIWTRESSSVNEEMRATAALVGKEATRDSKVTEQPLAEQTAVRSLPATEKIEALAANAQLISGSATIASVGASVGGPRTVETLTVAVASLKSPDVEPASEFINRTTKALDAQERVTEADAKRAIQEEIRLHREVTARLVAEEQSAIATSEASRDRAEAARKAKVNRSKRQLKADERLRDSIIHQLKTRQFQAAEQDKLMALLQRLGISQKEYYALVAVLGELEAQRQAAGLKGFQHEPMAVEVEAENSTENTRDAAAAEPQISGALSKNDRAVVSAIDASKRTTRGELFARLRQAEE
jgi:hypothetical protein